MTTNKKETKYPTVLYTDYSQLSMQHIDYILSCADADKITDIPLDDINNFLNEE
jgi:hypothetical protein